MNERSNQTFPEAAFNELVAGHKGKVEDWIITRSPRITHDVDDLQQEVWLKVYKSMPDFRAQSSFLTWLFKVTRNVKIDYLRQKKGKNKQKPEEVAISPTIVEEILPQDVAGGYDMICLQETISMLNQTLDELPDEQRQVFILTEVENLSEKEIADKLGIPIGTVGSRLFSARKHLLSAVQNIL
ncbi:sigma-70 family RNA polymerase sigma factor [Patescibacteria group bacterium]|nr:sigma-70 family RNA polymerase sigma factor [Patescibacteria group bacterium]